ncbi:ATP-dependent helicase [Pampinifervens florentissimum]|uniref:ATP-dependent helicase n=1 Tax=Pampinifervens florentissimum TaxID=1632019 RepID=UPI0013B49E63|nr:ATP-dependent helicase [Hydrogenobacter sp. T-8]QID32599.1 UvrD-helicase domain-containing protein [Hydrogenobacter sp. T-8]
MEGLNPSQERAVKHFGKPLLIIAGAGSGKTKTLAHKVEFLIREKGIAPERLLAITFTNKAGKEIRDRVKRVAGVDLPWAGTFHSVALRLLRAKGKQVGISTNFSILSEGDRNQIIKKLSQSINTKPETLKNYLSERFENLREPYDEKLEYALQEYLKALKSMNLLDFSTLMLYTRELLLKNQSIRENFDFVLVDEFQDTNTVQYEILKLLARENVCVVGDPNQCIYEWRYARPDNILRFKEDFNPDVIKLEYNYRSRPYIIHIANAVLSASNAEWKSLIPTLRPVKEGGQKPTVRRFEREEEEAVWIATKVKELLQSYKPHQIAILVRVGYITEPFERALAGMRILYKIVGAIRFFERAEIKDVLSFFRVLTNPYDAVSFSRALEVATRGIGEKTLEHILQAGRGNCLAGSQAILKSLPQAKAVELYGFLQKLSRLYKRLEDYPQAIEDFLREIDFWDYLRESYKDAEEREENVKELLRYLRQKHSEGYRLVDVLEEVDFLTEREEEEGAVKISTIHASKGLEFDVVFLPRLEEGILPHEKAKESQEEMEEELRLFYVAITRAKELLFMTYTRNSKPSRFLSLIPKELLDLSAFAKKKTTYMPELKSLKDFKVGDRVLHEIFGEGVILAIEDSKALVEFKAGRKSIHTAFLKPVV